MYIYIYVNISVYACLHENYCGAQNNLAIPISHVNVSSCLFIVVADGAFYILITTHNRIFYSFDG